MFLLTNAMTINEFPNLLAGECSGVPLLASRDLSNLDLDVQPPKEAARARFFWNYSPFHGFWQIFISIEVCRDCIPALASSCKKQLTGFFVCLLFFLKVKHIS